MSLKKLIFPTLPLALRSPCFFWRAWVRHMLVAPEAWMGRNIGGQHRPGSVGCALSDCINLQTLRSQATGVFERIDQ